MNIPTVRVKNPRGDGYMVINQSDLNGTHEMWPQQAHDYVKVAPAAPVQANRESEAAVRIFGKLMARQLGMLPEQWAQLSMDERADFMLAEEPKIDDHVGRSVFVAAAEQLAQQSKSPTTPEQQSWKKPK